MRQSLQTKLVVLMLIMMALTLGVATAAIMLLTRHQIGKLNGNTKSLITESYTRSNREVAAEQGKRMAKVLFTPVYNAILTDAAQVLDDSLRSSRVAAIAVWDAKRRLMVKKGRLDALPMHRPHPSALHISSNSRYLIVDLEIAYKGVLAGHLRMLFSNDNVKQVIAELSRAQDRSAGKTQRVLLWALLGIGLLLFLAGFLASRHWARKMTRPLEQLRQSAQSIIKGDAVPSLEVKTGDEIEVLSRSLDLMVSVERSLREEQLKNTEELRQWRTYVKVILESMADALLVIDSERKLSLVNRATCKLLDYDENQLIGQPASLILVNGVVSQLAVGEPLSNRQIMMRSRAGHEIPVNFSSARLNTPDGPSMGHVAVARDMREIIRLVEEKTLAVAARQHAEEVKEIQEQLLDVARQAGMAQVATGIIHNIGNVLNTLNISAALLSETVFNSKIGSLNLLAQLFVERGHDPEFFTSQKGRQALEYFPALTELLSDEHRRSTEELQLVLAKINHIREIVVVQQEYARGTGFRVEVNLADLVADCVRVHSESAEKHRISVRVHSDEVPLIHTDRSKLMQVVINLLSNATDALRDTEPGSENKEKVINVKLQRTGEDEVLIAVDDNGIGIDPEHRESLFSYGFTTKSAGHGFGLHYCANAVAELGGRIRVESDGRGHGAVFSCTLPINRSQPRTVA